MTESVTPSLADYQQYYRGCYCLLLDKLIVLSSMDALSTLHYQEIDETYTPYMRTAAMKTNKVATAQYVFENKRPFIPQYGFIPTSDKTVAYVALMPNRQYYRDFTPNRLKINTPNGVEAGAYGLNPYDLAAISVILKNNKFVWSVEEALDKLYSGDLLGVPLSHDYALVSTFTNKDAALFRKNKMIGIVNRKAQFTPSRSAFNDLPNLPTGIKRAS